MTFVNGFLWAKHVEAWNIASNLSEWHSLIRVSYVRGMLFGGGISHVDLWRGQRERNVVSVRFQGEIPRKPTAVFLNPRLSMHTLEPNHSEVMKSSFRELLSIWHLHSFDSLPTHIFHYFSWNFVAFNQLINGRLLQGFSLL